MRVSLYKSKRATAHNPKRHTWQIRWVGTDGKRYCETIGDAARMTKTDAEIIRRQRQGKMDNGLAPVNRPGRLGLAEFLRRDREAVAIDVKAKTLSELETAGAHAVRALGGTLDVQRLDHAAVGRLKKHLADRGLAAATIVKVVRYLQGAFSRGLKLQLVTSNPFKGVKLPKIQARAVQVYRLHEVEAMIAVAPSWWATFIRLAHTSGLRAGELHNLLWSDVDLEARTVTVAPKKAGRFTVGGQEYPILPWTSKSYGTRTVPIPPATVTALQRWKLRTGGSAYVFLSLDRLAVVGEYLAAHDGGLPGSYTLASNVTRDFRGIQDAAAARLSEGATKPYEWRHRTVHDLRRSYGTVLARHVPIHELKRLLGHSSIRTTEGFYLAAGDDISAKVTEAFASVA